MAKKDTRGFDPQKRYLGVEQQPGKVQRDSDRNQGGGRPWFQWLGGAAGLAALAVVAFALWQRFTIPQLDALALITQPGDGAILPLHRSYAVQGEASSSAGVTELQLLVNSQPWGSRPFAASPTFASGDWQWTPSAEGVHELRLRAIDGSGKVNESDPVEVYVSADADANFPYEVIAQDGDTFDSLAEQYGVDPQGLIDNHPEFDPGSPIPAGGVVTIPVTMPNGDPAGPESGAPPAPPKAPLPDLDADPSLIIPILFNLDSGPAFVFIDGKVVPAQPVDNLYLYISVDGELPFRRIPEDPMTFLMPQVGGFDISAYLDLAALEASPESHSLDVEAWGWQGGSLIPLGKYHGLIGGGLTGWPPSQTQLQVLTHTIAGIPQYAHETNLVGESANRVVDFNWSTTTPPIFVLWQVSDQPFPPQFSMSPDGLVDDELMFGAATGSGDFRIDFRKFIKYDGFGNIIDQITNAFEDAADWLSDLVGGSSSGVANNETQKTFPSSLPVTFYVRVVAMSSEGKLPSNTVVVRYLPSGEVLAAASPQGPVYEVSIAGYTPFRPQDPAYEACTVTTQDLTFNSFAGEDGKIPAGTLRCGCPGVKCSSGGGDSCGWNPICYGEKGLNALAEGVKWVANAVVEVGEFFVDLYNEAKTFVIEAVASFACAWSENEGQRAACELAINAAVNVAITAFTGLPPDIPNLEKLFDEGLEYAIAAGVAQATGFECDKTCRDLLKKGVQGVSNPEQLYQEGLNYGISLAVGELEELGVDCGADCQNVIKGVQQGVDLSNLSPEQIEAELKQMAHDAAQELINQNKPCDAQCENAIYLGYKNGNSLAASAAAAAANPVKAPEPPLIAPHPLAVDQPALLELRVFRRWESAQLNSQIIAERCGAFSLDNLATNQSWSTQVDGRLFELELVDMPMLQPGESLTIPIKLNHAYWELPEGFDWSQIPPTMRGYADLGTEDGEPIGQVQQQLNLDAWWMWNVLYYGSTVDFNVFTSLMADVVDGQYTSFPCFAAAGDMSLENPQQ